MASRHRIPIDYAFTPVPNTFIEHHIFLLNDTQIRVYLVILRMTRGHQKKRDSISISQIAKMSGFSRRTVDRSLAKLREEGLLETIGPPKRAKVYEILVPRKLKSRSVKLVTLPIAAVAP